MAGITNVILFPGQGAQFSGMGKNFYEGFSQSAEIFDKADAMRPGTSQQCFEGDEADLKKTNITQPCLFTVGLAAAEALRAKGFKADAVAGYSLGELEALVYAGVMNFEEGFELIQHRGRLMQQAAEDNPSSMMAVVKLTNEQVEDICREVGGIYPVNYNCPGQLTASGPAEKMKEFAAVVKAAGGRALPVKVAGGFHSPFMDKAAEEFGKIVRTIEMKEPEIPVYSDYTGKPYSGDFHELMTKQVNNPVRWQTIIEDMIGQGAKLFVEAAPGSTLCSLVKKIDSSVDVITAEEYLF